MENPIYRCIGDKKDALQNPTIFLVKALGQI